MIRLFIMIALFFVAMIATSKEIDLELQGKLIDLGIKDQQVREDFASVDFQSDKGKQLAEKMESIDQANFTELEDIIERYGWPGTDLVGDEASNAAFLILQHARLPEQNKYLHIFRQAVSRKKARAQDLALLEDRILIREGKKQLYGSQLSTGPNGEWRLDPIDDPTNLDSRRKAIGLPPIKEYLNKMRAYLGKSIDIKALNSQ